MSDFKEQFPALLSKIEDDIEELRYLVVVDDNYADIDDEEVDIFDPTDYNYLVYLPQRVVEALKEDGINKLVDRLSKNSNFENFIASEEDLYGIKSDLDSKGVAYKILEDIETILSKEANI